MFQLLIAHLEESITIDIMNNFHPDFSSALQDTEHGDLPSRSPAPVTLSSPAKVRLIRLNLSRESE